MVRSAFQAIAAALLLTSQGFSSDRDTLKLYVAPGGSDARNGRSASVGKGGEGPFATFEHARDEIRTIRDKGVLGNRPVVVNVRGGAYYRAGTLELSNDDSGSPNAPVIWKSYPGERVRVIGGIRPRTWMPVTNPAVLERLCASAKQHVVCLDLRKEGVQDFGTIVPRGNPGLELFFDGRRMQLARWPNEGWLHIADVPQTGDSLYHKGLEREKRFNGVPVGRHYGRIQYDGNRPSRWSPENQILLHGYWTFDWSDSYQWVQSIDTIHKEITLAVPHHGYGYTKNQRYAFLNVLEEIDTPGEWYLDRKMGILYLWPPSPPAGKEILVSILEEPFVKISNTHDIRIEGITFECARGNAIRTVGGSRVTIAGCDFLHLGDDAVVIDGGESIGVQSCDIHEVARGGVKVAGGDRPKLVPAGNYVSNTLVHHYGTWLRTGAYATILEGVGNRIDHCVFHDAPFEAIGLRGNDHLVEYNEVHHTMRETGDAGALHTGRNWTWRGNVIRYNYFHHLQGPGLHGVMGVYLDDWASGFTVFGNVFYKAGRATLIGGGRDNIVENNLYIECSPSVHVDARGLGWAKYYFDGTYPTLFTTLEEMKHTVPPYSTRYPGLATILSDEPVLPRGNRIAHNISLGGRFMDIYDYLVFDFSIVDVRDNLIADPVVVRRRQDGESGWDPYYLDIDLKEGYVSYKMGDLRMRPTFAGNILSRATPRVQILKDTIPQMLDASVARKIGFKPIPVKKIGLQKDSWRRSIATDLRGMPIRGN
jgi:hypothetical protein